MAEQKKIINLHLKKSLLDFYYVALSVVIALVIGGVFLICMGYSPFMVYRIIFMDALVDFTSVLRRATPLMMTAIAVALPFKCGMMNMGGEGQIIAGALTAGVVGSTIQLPTGIHVIVTIAAAMLVGGALAAIPAWMKVKFGSTEVVVTLMMNYVILYIVQYLTMYIFRGSDYAVRTADVLDTAIIPGFTGQQFTWSLVISIVVCLLVAFIMNSTTFGMELKSAGFNQLAAKFQGINVKVMSLLAMTLGGMIAALGGALEVMGGTGNYFDTYFSDYGFDGVAIAFMAKQNPVAVIFTSIIISILKIGAMSLARQTNISMYFSYMLQGIIIVLLVSPYFVEWGMGKLKSISKKEAA